MDTFYLYIEAAAANWWWYMMSVPFIIDECLKWISPSFKDWLEFNLTKEKRRKYEIALMVAGVFIAGFFAFRDEHILRESAEKRLLNEKGAVLKINKIYTMTYPGFPNNYIALEYTSSGNEPLEAPIIVTNVYVSNIDKELSKEEIDQQYAPIDEKIKETTFPNGDRSQIENGQNIFFTFGYSLDSRQLSDIVAGKSVIYLYAAFAYRDQTLEPYHRKITEFCAYVTQTFSYWHSCQGHNKTFKW